MAQPKKQTSPRKQGLRRSHLVLKLARRVNAMSPVKVNTLHHKFYILCKISRKHLEKKRKNRYNETQV